MTGFIEGVSRAQTTLFPESLDDYISEDNPVRVIDVFVDSLDLSELGFKTISAGTGRPGYHPSSMLKLYLYGYLNRVQSSRRLEREAGRNVELMWLIQRLCPDFKTIADFRKDNALGIKNTCKSFIALCRHMNLFTDAMIAVDGSKFKAVNNKGKNYTPKKLQFHIDRAEKSINQYLNMLDKTDRSEELLQDGQPLENKIKWLKGRIDEFKAIEAEVHKHPDKQISTTDPDSRLMKTRAMTREVCYNVQAAVDAENHLIVSHDVTNKPDRGQLSPTAKAAQEAMGIENLMVLADKGYYSGLDIKETIDAGMLAIVPKGDTSGSEKKGIFNRSEFKYEPKKDVYICPANQELTYRFTGVEKGLEMRKYFLDVMTCRECAYRSQCSSSSKHVRRISRWEHQSCLDGMEQLKREMPNSMLIRKQTVEHPFGTIKSWMGATHFLTKGLENVKTEMNLHVLAYNLKRLMGIFGTKELIRAIQ